ncbi:MAG: type VI secretion protein IcmF/TssM N-terminal domain-containing protein [Pseudomonadota bacterium]|nr:type VI secretion protein IcmF/TssM N-terminal domain-containing protein [Pseudomonadota bacterium]
MLRKTLNSLKVDHNNTITCLLLIIASLPMTQLPIGGNIQSIEATVALISIGYCGGRALVYYTICMLNQQKILYLWALHTFSRLQEKKKPTLSNQLSRHFHKKIFLVIGNKQSGKTVLLKQSNAEEIQSCIEYQQNGRIEHTIWSLKENILLETTCLMPHNKETQVLQKTYWQNLIRLNKWHHNHMGFNSVLIVLSIQNILSEKKAHPTQSIEALRNQIQNVCSHSKKMPIFFILTGLDHLPGFQPFFKNIDNEDIDRPLGFVIPKSQQADIDIQEELDKVANDIETFLIYQLEKVIHGEKNDVEKMHQFHEGFKELKPKIIQILYGIKTHISNPISGMFFASHCEKASIDTKNTIHSNAIESFYTQKRRSYFHKQILNIIDENTPWQVSKKIQQYFLLIIGLMAWQQSNISIEKYLFTPVQKNINYLFSTNDIQKERPNTTAIDNQINTKIKKSIQADSPSQTIKTAHFNSVKKMETGEKKTVNQGKNTSHKNIELWDQLKQTIHHKITHCELFQNSTCTQMAYLISEIKRSSAISKAMLTEAVKKQPKLKDMSIQLDTERVPLTKDQQHEVDYLINKIRKQNKQYQKTSPSLKLLEQISPEFAQQSHTKKIEMIKEASTNTCHIMSKLNPIFNISTNELATCIPTLTYLASNQALTKTIQQYQQAIQTYHSEKTLEGLLKKTMYLQANIEIITESMQRISKNLENIRTHKENFSPEKWNQLEELTGEVNKFDTKEYKKVLQKVIMLSKEILTSKNKDMAFLQTLEMLLEQEKTNTLWPNHWIKLDKISQDCILSFEKIIISNAGDYLNQTWKKNIATPYKEQLKNHYPFDEQSNSQVSLEIFHKFFSSTGIINTFNNKYLHNLMDIDSENGPQWKKIHGRPLPYNKDISSFIMGSTIIQKMFYPNNTPSLWFEGVLRYRHTNDKVKSIQIIQDSNTQTLNTTQASPIHIKWPYANEAFTISMTLENGQNVKLTTETGPWSMIKFLKKSSQKNNRAKKHILKLEHYQHHLELEFDSQNAINPLSVDINRILTPPETLAQNAN